jgi:hypothetical protein
VSTPTCHSAGQIADLHIKQKSNWTDALNFGDKVANVLRNMYTKEEASYTGVLVAYLMIVNRSI